MLASFVCAVDVFELLVAEDGFELKSSGWTHPADLVDDLRLIIPGTPGVDLEIKERKLRSFDVAMANPNVVNGRFPTDTHIGQKFDLAMDRAELQMRLRGVHLVRLNIGERFKPTTLS